MKKIFICFASLALSLTTLAFFPLTAKAATRDVCATCTYLTINAAVTAAVAGDTILVSPGTYNESVAIAKDNLTLISVAGAASTIITNAADAIVITDGDNLRIEGFTLTSTATGSGISVDAAASGIITNNIVTGIVAADQAGIGLWVSPSFEVSHNVINNNNSVGIMVMLTTAETNLIHDNQIEDNPVGIEIFLNNSPNIAVYNNDVATCEVGIAVVTNTSSVSVHNNSLHDNVGGLPAASGIYVSSVGGAQVHANKVYQNTNTAAAGIMLTSENSAIFNNFVSENSATRGLGGGIVSVSNSSPIFNNTIVNNTATGGAPNNENAKFPRVKMKDASLQQSIDDSLAKLDSSWASAFNGLHDEVSGGTLGGGVWINYGNVAPPFYNNILWGNTDDITDIIGGLVVDYSDIQDGWTGSGSNNISANPVLTSYVLGESSPCIDAGTATNAPRADIDGTLRPQRNGIDIGAYELGLLPQTGTATTSNHSLLYLLIFGLVSILFVVVGKKYLFKR